MTLPWPLTITRCVPHENLQLSHILNSLLNKLGRSRSLDMANIKLSRPRPVWLIVYVPFYVCSVWTQRTSALTTKKKTLTWFLLLNFIYCKGNGEDHNSIGNFSYC